MNKRKKLYLFMMIATFITIILFAISSIYVEKFDTFVPMIVTGCLMFVMLVLTISIYIKYIEYICPKCNQIFKPSKGRILVSIHTPTRRLLRCPCCNAKSWCKDHFE